MPNIMTMQQMGAFQLQGYCPVAVLHNTRLLSLETLSSEQNCTKRHIWSGYLQGTFSPCCFLISPHQVLRNNLVCNQPLSPLSVWEVTNLILLYVAVSKSSLFSQKLIVSNSFIILKSFSFHQLFGKENKKHQAPVGVSHLMVFSPFLFQQTSEPNFPEIVLIAINKQGVSVIHQKTKVTVASQACKQPTLLNQRQQQHLLSQCQRGQDPFTPFQCKTEDNVIASDHLCSFCIEKGSVWGISENRSGNSDGPGSWKGSVIGSLLQKDALQEMHAIQKIMPNDSVHQPSDLAKVLPISQAKTAYKYYYLLLIIIQ